MTQLTLNFFGSFTLTVAGKPVTNFESDKVRALLIYLAIESEHPQRRERLAGLLWPDKSERAARNNLRHVLPKLRHAIGDRSTSPPFLLISRSTLQFNPNSDYHCDVSAFQGLVERGLGQQAAEPLKQAVALYRGPFLAGFSPNISGAFDDWLCLLRERFQQQALSALDWLTTDTGERGEYAQAHDYAQHQISLAPWREEAHQQAMRYLALNGQRSAALAQFESCRHYLNQELAVAPSQTTLTLLEQIQAGEFDQPSTARNQVTPPHNLPAQTTPFIGRQTELKQIRAWFTEPTNRLITLHGPGGIGKTRLALEVAAKQVRQHRHGVYFVSAAALESVDALIAAIADAVNFPFQSDSRSPRRQLLDFLQAKQLLLLLDNLEHLPESVPFLNEMLQVAPGLRLLTTSRTRLMLSGETVFTLNGLAMSEPASAFNETDEALALFLTTARRVQPAFQLTNEAKGQVVQICQAVQGMPLGILLAASWLGQLTLAEITSQLVANNEQPLDFLETEWRDFPDRQRSMRAVCAHSWHLLSADEQTIFSQLSIFRGGFTRQAAQVAIGASLQSLTALVNKSLLQREPNGRYTIHELLRQFGKSQLERSDQLAATAESHATYYLTFLQQRKLKLKGRHQMTTLAEIDDESENVRGAWQWAVSHQRHLKLAGAAESLALFYERRGRYQAGEAAFAFAAQQCELLTSEPAQKLWLRLVAYQIDFCQTLGQFSQATDLLQKGLERLKQSPLNSLELRAEKAMLHRLMGVNVRVLSGFVVAEPYLNQSLTYARAMNDRWQIALTLRELAKLALYTGDYPTMHRYLKEILAIQREVGDIRGEAHTLGSLGFNALEQGHYTKAEALQRQSLAKLQALGEVAEIGKGSGGLAILLLMQGHYEEACALMAQNLHLAQQLGNAVEVVTALGCLSVLEGHLGNFVKAEAYGQQALKLAQAQNDQWAKSGVRRALGRLALVRQDYETAYEHLCLSLTLSENTGPRELHFRTRTLLAFAERGLGQQAQARATLLVALKETYETHVQVTLMHAFTLMALFLLDQGQPERAIELYALASSHPIVANSRWFEQQVGQPIATATATLSPAVVTAAQTQGRAGQFEATRAALIAELAAYRQPK